MNYDIIIKNTNIVDGTGKRSFNGDIGIIGEKIEKIGNFNGNSENIIDGTGLITAPGFIDIHSHADTTIYKYPSAYNLIMQGITTFVGGNCGFSLAPYKKSIQSKIMKSSYAVDYKLEWESFNDWINAVSKKDLSVNYIPLVGYNTIRDAVMSADTKREATNTELKELKELAIESLESGAHGISFMLDPGASSFHASRNELIEIVKLVKKYDRFFTIHTRHHQNQWPVEKIEQERYGCFYGFKGEIIAGRYHGLLEAIEISRAADNAKLHISHLTPAYIIPQPHSKKLDEALATATLEDVIDKAIMEGIDISFDVIPCEYSIGSTNKIINEFIKNPYSSNSFNKEDFIKKLAFKRFRKKITKIIFSGKFKFGMINPVTDPYWFDCYKIIECKNKNYKNKVLGSILRDQYGDNSIEMVYEKSLELLFDILQEDPSVSWALVKDKRESGVIDFFLKHPVGVPCSDMILSLPCDLNQNLPISFYGISPLFFGIFIHFLRKMVKEKHIFTLEEAIMKITSIPAEKILFLKNRGIIKKGAYADLVMFDLDSLRENDDYNFPYKTPKGIINVLVNGKIVCENGNYIGGNKGKILI